MCRYIDFELLEPWERGNKLASEPPLEYAVHGQFRRTADDANGVYGCWWIGLLELVATLGEAQVTEAVATFERELVTERVEAMTRVLSKIVPEPVGAE